MEKLITRKEAARILGISIATLDAARNNGLISYVQYVQTGQNRWKRIRLTARPGTPEHEPIRILAGTEDL